MKNNSKTDRRRLLNLSMRVVLALVMVGLLVVPVAVQADLKATAVVYAWDHVANKFQNSNVIIPWDGTWIPFLHELNFDTDLWTEPSTCDPGESTRWAGEMFYGLYHVDDAPLGAPGFQESAQWSLVSCDRNGDGSFDNADLSLPIVEIALPTEPPPHYFRPDTTIPGVTFDPIECTTGGETCRLVSSDQREYCTTGNCYTEIVTTIEVNLNRDCGYPDEVDEDLNIPLDPRTGHPQMLCFYAEARTPDASAYLVQPNMDNLPPIDPPLPLPLLVWSNPLQARISTVGGDKTVNFAADPTAVELAAFEATPQGNGVMLTWETATEIDNLGFNIYRAESQAGQLVKINQHLMASQNPGSTAGAAYSFLDESAAPGATYYYWLEDIDASGMATKHGPVTAKRAAAKALPGRPRPAPMPGNAF